jgi:hypothetical protein
MVGYALRANPPYDCLNRHTFAFLAGGAWTPN